MSISWSTEVVAGVDSGGDDFRFQRGGGGLYIPGAGGGGLNSAPGYEWRPGRGRSWGGGPDKDAGYSYPRTGSRGLNGPDGGAPLLYTSGGGG